MQLLNLVRIKGINSLFRIECYTSWILPKCNLLLAVYTAEDRIRSLSFM